MKKSKLSFLVLASVLGSAAVIASGCGGGDSTSSGNSKGTGGAKGGEGGEGGDHSSATGGEKAQGGAAGGTNVDKCDGVTCKNDDNPCTEDACNPATGKCGIPRTGTTCNDGLYCNGTDKCDAGKCTKHTGMPCADGQACNEDSDSCECNGDEDCPVEEDGEWTTPSYDGVCDETGAKSRTVTTYTCESGMCKAHVASQDGADTRSTDNTACTDDDLFCNGTAHCIGGSCVPTGNPCAGGTFCNEGQNACWVCENDQANGATDDGCTSGAPNCCNNSCGTTTCGFVSNTTIAVNNTVIGNTVIVNQLVFN